MAGEFGFRGLDRSWKTSQYQYIKTGFEKNQKYDGTKTSVLTGAHHYVSSDYFWNFGSLMVLVKNWAISSDLTIQQINNMPTTNDSDT